MTLEFIDHRAVGADTRRWTPFEQSDGYDHPLWWLRAATRGDPWFVQVLEAGVEVARLQLDEKVGIETYAQVPSIGPERLEIQFIEVAVAARERRIGTRVVRGLEERHPDRRLLAYSESADRFWASLGWQRFDHPEGRPEFHRALFIQPAH